MDDDQQASPASERYAKFPSDLKALPQWVNYTLEWNDKHDRITKVPRKMDGRKAASTRPNEWTTFENAVATALRRGSVMHADGTSAPGSSAGIGFVLTADDPYCCVDLDHCCPEPGAPVEDWAQKIIDNLDSYTEYSPSKTGVHIFVKAQLPRQGRKKRIFGPDDPRAVEIYDRARFMTVTGDSL